MTAVQIPAELPLLAEAKDKVAILTGGSAGIGEALVRRLHSHGAIVHFLDVDAENGKRLEKELGGVTFHHGSVTSWADQLSVFESAASQNGHIDMVFANAGIDEVAEDVFVDTFDDVGKLKAPTLVVLDVDLRGVLYTAKLALSFFRKLPTPGGGAFVATGSAASYLDTQGIPIYNAAKHGIIGLIRSLRNSLSKEKDKGIRINMVAPAMVDTPFTQHVLPRWKANNLPVNQPDDIARALLFLGLNQEYHGRALFVAGGAFVEVEGPYEATRSIWLGQENEDWIQRKNRTMKLGKQDD